MRIVPVTKNLQSLTEERHLTARTIESNVTVYSADNQSTPSDDATGKLLKLTNPKGYPVKPISTLQYLQLAKFFDARLRSKNLQADQAKFISLNH